MALHWESSHFGSFEPDLGCDFGGDINGVPGVGIDFAGEMNGVPGVGIDFGCDLGGDVNASTVDFGIEPMTAVAAGAVAGALSGLIATAHHVVSMHHILKHRKSPAHVAAQAISVHDAENAALSGPAGADPYQLEG